MPVYASHYLVVFDGHDMSARRLLSRRCLHCGGRIDGYLWEERRNDLCARYIQLQLGLVCAGDGRCLFLWCAAYRPE
ncbi:hypothetical protein VTL71DRAFT_14923 [Oculimacula yallundae]|uniref:Uncharacterized protein n=1 Tax=Oculimacula yallundae TaxID=86028 RepID=A0ABR4CGF0_9HELO